MGVWKKLKPTQGQAYAVVAVGERYGIALCTPGRPPERVKSIGLRTTQDALQGRVARMNSRLGITPERAAAIAGALR